MGVVLLLVFVIFLFKYGGLCSQIYLFLPVCIGVIDVYFWM